jgi:Dynamin family
VIDWHITTGAIGRIAGKVKKMNDTFSISLAHYQQQRSLLISLTEKLLVLVETLRNPTLLRELEHVRSQILSHTITVLVAGELNAGKSTIINALLQAKFLPAYPVPTTAALTQVKHGEPTKIVLHHHLSSDGTRPPPLEVALTEMEFHLMFDQHRRHTHNIEKVEVFLPLPPLYNNVEFIDLVSPYDDDGYEKSLMCSAPSADVILYATSCDTFPSKEDALTIDWIRSAGHNRLLFLCNRFDLVEPQSQTRVKRRYFTYLSQLTGHGSVFFTSAKLALDGYLRGDTRQVAQSNLPLLKDALESFIAERGSQKLQPMLAQLTNAIHLSLEAVSARKKLQHPVLQTRLDSRVTLLYKCKLLSEQRLHLNDELNVARQQIGKEVEVAAKNFYRECSYTLDSIMQHYVPQQAHSTWDAFSGDASERLAKSAITFLTETLREQFQAWVASTLEPLLQQAFNPIAEALAEDTVAQIVRSVENRVNFTWHATPLIKRVFEHASPNFQSELATNPPQMKTHLLQVYRHELAESTQLLVAAINDIIDGELYQRQQELDHLLDREFQCLSDVVRFIVEEEQAQENATGHLLPALEENLYTIEQELNDLKKTMPMKNTMFKETNNEHESVDQSLETPPQSQSQAFKKSSTIPPADK